MSRSAVSTADLVGTLAGATALPLVGTLIDRYGVRRCMVVIGAAPPDLAHPAAAGTARALADAGVPVELHM